jgi:hypothetical protein
MRSSRPGFLDVLALNGAGCQPNTPIRDQTRACTPPPNVNGNSCGSYSLEHRLQDHPDQSFLLGFVEFDDQGRPYIRDLLFNRIKLEAQYRDL